MAFDLQIALAFLFAGLFASRTVQGRGGIGIVPKIEKIIKTTKLIENYLKIAKMCQNWPHKIVPKMTEKNAKISGKKY